MGIPLPPLGLFRRRLAPARETPGQNYSQWTQAADLVFIPTAAPTVPDYYAASGKRRQQMGQLRRRPARFTGGIRLGFKCVHTTCGIYDVASQPRLSPGGWEPQHVAITTKDAGQVFVAEPAHCAPHLFPSKNAPSPRATSPAKEAYPTQPHSALSVVPEGLSPSRMHGPKPPEERQWCAEKIKTVRNEAFSRPPAQSASSFSPAARRREPGASSAYDRTANSPS